MNFGYFEFGCFGFGRVGYGQIWYKIFTGHFETGCFEVLPIYQLILQKNSKFQIFQGHFSVKSGFKWRICRGLLVNSQTIYTNINNINTQRMGCMANLYC
jgi:hypothetical protein